METCKIRLRQALLTEIEKAKDNMVQVAKEEGITSENTLQVSQSIGQLLNELHKLTSTKY
ncbi:aspartyl-phosphate phosphatase Spo0E family protein [Priestia megaterium]|uniref:aspartyl-phosphate phosphatase Spo0E family protein n=1 Tax=Priestia megaterium TaxID=1404 RepID=UPI002363BF87|nr:aspartyl-phosphate phosphatase Spo0E family protein [Priestia megaterium]MDD1516165.1 aspartyl-phosphate phosphatase Spo0E family protein [Priestia megaterium]